MIRAQGAVHPGTEAFSLARYQDIHTYQYVHRTPVHRLSYDWHLPHVRLLWCISERLVFVHGALNNQTRGDQDMFHYDHSRGSYYADQITGLVCLRNLSLTRKFALSRIMNAKVSWGSRHRSAHRQFDIKACFMFRELARIRASIGGVPAAPPPPDNLLLALLGQALNYVSSVAISPACRTYMHSLVTPHSM